MIVTGQIAEVRAIRWANPTVSWGFVPTMGYLHQGHLALVHRARRENDRLAASIYVNPTQFDRPSDLASYPRNLQGDLAKLEAAGVDLVFTPNDESMYPSGFQTTVTISEVTKPLEGAARPSHFDGVATVVAKLFNIVEPTRAYFGQKDVQQTVVIGRLVADLNLNVALVICPTVREEDGLAMSSRNVRLTPEQRAAAPILFAALSGAARQLHDGEREAGKLRKYLRETITSEPLARVDYVSVADPETLLELDQVKDRALLSLAAFFGDVRLIDNLPVDLDKVGEAGRP